MLAHQRGYRSNQRRGGSQQLPECGSELIVDALTGEILSHRAPKAPLAGGNTLDSLERLAELTEAGLPRAPRRKGA